MKFRHYGVVVVTVLLAVAVLWQVGREVVAVVTVPVIAPGSQPASSPAVAVPPANVIVVPPATGTIPVAPTAGISLAQEAARAALAEKRKSQVDLEKRQLADQEARRRAEEESRRLAQETGRTGDAEVRLHQEEVARQPKPIVLPEQKSPEQACADRPNFISRGICEAHECEKPERSTLQFCIDMHERRAPREFAN